MTRKEIEKEIRNCEILLKYLKPGLKRNSVERNHEEFKRMLEEARD